MQSLALSFANFRRYLSQPLYQTPLANQDNKSLLANLRQFASESALFLFLLGFTIMFSLEYTHITGDQVIRSLVEKYQSRLVVLTLSLLIAVLLEEAFFRSILRLTTTNLRNVAIVILFILLGIGYRPLKELVGPMAGLGLIATWGVAAWALNRYLKRPAVFARVQRFWRANFKSIFYVVGLFYALIKTADDINVLTGWQLLLLPALMGLSLLSSFYFGYVRMKFGFWYAVAVHTLILGSVMLSQAVFTL